MKEQDLKDLGFKKVNVSAKESGSTPFYYYVYYAFKKRDFFGLISNSNDQLVNGKWAVAFFEYDCVVFKKKSDVKKLIDLIKNNRI